MADFYLSRAALADLDDIWDYISQSSLVQADKVQDRILAACQKISDNAHMGRPRPELRPELRSFLEKPYVLFYTIDSEGVVTIRRVIHHSRDLEALF